MYACSMPSLPTPSYSKPNAVCCELDHYCLYRMLFSFDASFSMAFWMLRVFHGFLMSRMFHGFWMSRVPSCFPCFSDPIARVLCNFSDLPRSPNRYPHPDSRYTTSPHSGSSSYHPHSPVSLAPPDSSCSSPS